MSPGLKREQKIRKKTEFQILFKKAVISKGKYLTARILQRKESGQAPQIAVSVSRRTSKKATVRNLWRRRILEAFRNNQREVLPGTILWIQVRGEGTAPEYNKIEKELIEVVQKTQKTSS